MNAYYKYNAHKKKTLKTYLEGFCVAIPIKL